MFSLSGARSPISVASQVVLDHCGFLYDLTRDDSFATTLYRRDPLDKTLYLTAYSGIRQTQPMFGSLRWNDYRASDGGAATSDPFGFAAREGVHWVDKITGPDWVLYVNGRKDTARLDLERYRASLQSSLKALLVPDPLSRRPLFDDLWDRERLVRDQLREAVHECPPGTALEVIAAHVTRTLTQSFTQLVGDAGAIVGTYLDTGTAWQLCGSESTPPWLPDCVSLDPSNAFTWVGESLRPVLVGKDACALWRTRITACGIDFSQLLEQRSFQGLCLVPILYGPYRAKAFGVLCLTSQGGPLTPGHAFLLSRLSLAVSGYLFPLMPLPGFPWWPGAKLRRGRANVEVVSKPSGPRVDGLLNVAKIVTRDLMPYGSRVKITPLRVGQSGAHLFRLDVLDEEKIEEVPRVLKLGSSALIRNELQAYYRYAHNKLLGTDARIDTARSSLWPVDQPEEFEGAPPEAIVYTFVGAGEKAVPWSTWAVDVPDMKLKRGLDLLSDRLRGWYIRSRAETGSPNIIELMIGPLAAGQLKSYLDIQPTPSVEEVQRLLDDVYKLRLRPSRSAKTCIVHGDLHTDNLFAVLNSDDQLKGVALIDWASVRSGWHPLSDISKLMADLSYRVRPSPETRRSSFTVTEEWGKSLGCESVDWAVALIHQIAKIMFYRQSGSADTSYISVEARAAAWSDLQQLFDYLSTSLRQREGGTPHTEVLT